MSRVGEERFNREKVLATTGAQKNGGLFSQTDSKGGYSGRNFYQLLQWVHYCYYGLPIGPNLQRKKIKQCLGSLYLKYLEEPVNQSHIDDRFLI